MIAKELRNALGAKSDKECRRPSPLQEQKSAQRIGNKGIEFALGCRRTTERLNVEERGEAGTWGKGGSGPYDCGGADADQEIGVPGGGKDAMGKNHRAQ